MNEERTKSASNIHDFVDSNDVKTWPKLPHQDYRKGYTVQELIEALSLVEDKGRFVACPQFGFGGIEGVRNIQEITVGGYAGQYSYQETDVVLLK